MKPSTARFILCRVLGWRYDKTVMPAERCLFFGVPHTSLWDFVIGYLYTRAIGTKLRIMIKKEAFFFPVGPLLRSLGGFPIDRKNPQATIKALIGEINASQGGFLLAMCPEGTRKPVAKWKTGYHTIASQTGLTVCLSYYDYAKKYVTCGEPFALTDNAREDTRRIQEYYASKHLTAKHPEKFRTE